MKFRKSIPALCFAGILVAALGWWLVSSNQRQGDRIESLADTGTTARSRSAPFDPNAIVSSADGLITLAEDLRAMPREDAVARISELLASGRDFVTGSEFTLDADGNLSAAPTLRTMLLDELAAIDPAAAARISREILATPTSADEWAIALRNIGRVEDDADARDFLLSKTEELVTNPVWQAKPSIGYLNAFDVFVHTEAITIAPLLSSFIQNKERGDLAHAAFLTIDRLVQRRTTEMLEYLTTDAALSTSRPEMISQQIARADLRDDRQRELVEIWLLAPERSATELNAFASAFPNNNQFVSNNLLTKDVPVSGPELAAHDRAIMEIVSDWSQDAEFESRKPQLQTMLERLASFTHSDN